MCPSLDYKLIDFIIYFVHPNDATGHEGFQKVLGCRRHGKNKERMTKLIASELRGSDESGDEGTASMSFEHRDPIRWWAGSNADSKLVWLETFFQYKVSMPSLGLV